MVIPTKIQSHMYSYLSGRIFIKTKLKVSIKSKINYPSSMIPYIENPKDALEKLLELIDEFCEVAGYKIIIYRNLLHFYTNNTLSEREIKKTVPFTIPSKRIKYLGINLTKEVKELYSESCKTLMKEIEDDTNRWKDTPCSWIGRINIVKITTLPKAIYRFSVIHIKIPMAFFTKLEQII